MGTRVQNWTFFVISHDLSHGTIEAGDFVVSQYYIFFRCCAAFGYHVISTTYGVGGPLSAELLSMLVHCVSYVNIDIKTTMKGSILNTILLLALHHDLNLEKPSISHLLQMMTEKCHGKQQHCTWQQTVRPDPLFNYWIHINRFYLGKYFFGIKVFLCFKNSGNNSKKVNV